MQTRTFLILAALLGQFVTIKAQEDEDYGGGEFPFFFVWSFYCMLWNGKPLGFSSCEIFEKEAQRFALQKYNRKTAVRFYRLELYKVPKSLAFGALFCEHSLGKNY